MVTLQNCNTFTLYFSDTIPAQLPHSPGRLGDHEVRLHVASNWRLQLKIAHLHVYEPGVPAVDVLILCAAILSAAS